MKLNEVKEALKGMNEVVFELPDGKTVPAHFHVTEVGKIQKDFIDCGGKIRQEVVVNFQLWSSIDIMHRLAPQKMLNIINLSEEKLGLGNAEIEVEYQGANTIGKFGLEVKNSKFVLTNKKTDCLAKDQCGIPSVEKVVEEVSSCCTPGGGCC